MALKYSVSLRNAKLDVIETHVNTENSPTGGNGAVIRIKDGTVPATAETNDSTGHTTGATLTLPADWMAAASAGAKAKSGTWEDSSADATATVTYFRVYDSDGNGPDGTVNTSFIQGTVDDTGSPDMTVDNKNFSSGQTFTITTFTITDGNP